MGNCTMPKRFTAVITREEKWFVAHCVKLICHILSYLNALFAIARPRRIASCQAMPPIS
jgi:hypothetical protein